MRPKLRPIGRPAKADRTSADQSADTSWGLTHTRMFGRSVYIRTGISHEIPHTQMQCPQTPSPAPKAATGFSRSRTMASLRTSPPGISGYVGSSNWVPTDSSTGRSLFPPQIKLEVPTSSEPLAHLPTSSYQGPPQPTSTSGRMTPESMEPSSNLDNASFSASPIPTGTVFDSALFRETLMEYQMTYTFAATINCGGSARIIYDQLLWSGLVQFSGGRLGLASRERPGKMPVWTLILKLPQPSSGMVTEARNMLSSMNFEELSKSLTCSDGSIDTRVSLKLKDRHSCCEQLGSGSRQTSIPGSGTL